MVASSRSDTARPRAIREISAGARWRRALDSLYHYLARLRAQKAGSAKKGPDSTEAEAAFDVIIGITTEMAAFRHMVTKWKCLTKKAGGGTETPYYPGTNIAISQHDAKARLARADAHWSGTCRS